MEKPVAIFDVDGTIFRSSLLIEVVNALITKNMFPERARNGYAISYGDWLNRKGSYEDYILDVVKAFAKHITGIAQKDFIAVAKEVVELQKQRTYIYTRNLIKDLKTI